MSSRRSDTNKFVDRMAKRKGRFTRPEIEALVLMYTGLTAPRDADKDKECKLDRSKFRDFLHKKFEMTDDIFMDRVFKTFVGDNDNYISLEKFVLGMSKFLKGTHEELMEFCFGVYDMNSDGYISKEEMYSMLKDCLPKHTDNTEDDDESTKDIVEMVLKKMDFDHDGKISREDYIQTVAKDSMYLEIFGQCLPDEKCKEAIKAELSCHKSHI